MRPRTITQQVDRKCEIQTSRNPELSQTDLIKPTEQWKIIRSSCIDKVRTMLAALQDRTQYRPTNDSAPMNGLFDAQLRSLLASKKTMHSLRSIVQWVVRIVEKCWSFVNLCLLIFQRDKDLEIPRRSWLKSGNRPCGWARANSQTSIWDRTDEGVVYAQSARRLAEHSRKPSSNCRNTTKSLRHWTSLRQLTLSLKTKRCRWSHQIQR